MVVINFAWEGIAARNVFAINFVDQQRLYFKVKSFK